MRRLFLLLIPIAIAVTSCDNALDPLPNSDLTTDKVWQHATYGEGLLGEAYANLNYDYNIGLANYTDNAVPATQGENDIALGSWTVENNPIGGWSTYYSSIKYINTFLQHAYDLTYEVGAAQTDSLLRSHRIGEAYFLRGWYEWKLLQEYGGYVDGKSEAMGFPIVTEVLEKEDTINLPRDTYEDCVTQITADLDSAIARLPMEYNGSGDIYGNSNRGRGSALAAMALKSRLYLYAASPAYGSSSQQLWERAAEAAYDAIEAAGGLTNLKPYGNFNDYTNYDYIWIQPTYSGNGLERAYYPPSLYGSGTLNPSQNLVDAFPASDGYPIDQSGQYDSDNPYENRDPRLQRFVFFNGNKYNGTTVETFQGGADAPGGLSQQGTRTGYYLKKHTSRNVQLDPGNPTSDIKFKVFIDKAELYLNFAEAANEAYGPTGATLGYSAADALRQIRRRAGIDSDPNTSGYQDQYLDDQAAAGQDAFRDLVHNERRLELSFEGHRFWDIRRWNDPLDHTVEGMQISASDGQGTHRNLALESDPSSDYVSPYSSPLEVVKDGYEPQNSGDTSHGVYHNWYSGGEWRYLQYDFPSYLTSNGNSTAFTVDSTAIYWWTDGGGVLIPDSTYVEYWDMAAGAWTEVLNPSGYGTAADQWNTTTFDPVMTNSIRVHMKSNTQSTGVIEWKVWGKEADTPLVFTYQKVDVESHTYQDYMRYIPVPYNETLIMSNLQQNKGWQ